MTGQLSPNTALPIVIIGAGSVGIRLVRELLYRDPTVKIKIFGGEGKKPYSREYLSRLLAGKITEEKLHSYAELPDSKNIEAFYNNPINKIDRKKAVVVDSNGTEHPYQTLVLAVGSSPRQPEVQGVDLKNVILLRNLTDVEALMGRQVSSRNTVVIGGGLVGLDAANAMKRHNTDITVIERSTRLMHYQLDDHASVYLRLYLDDLDMDVRVETQVTEIGGKQGKVSHVILDDGEKIDCDTVIISIGINPNTTLAEQSGLNISRGIIVDDELKTNDPDIYALGECVEHRNRIYGRVKPGYDQAKVLAENLTGGKVKYKGSTATTSFKVIDYPIMVMGETIEEVDGGQEIFHRNIKKMKYRKLILKRGCLRGVIAAGAWKGTCRRLEQAVENRQFIWPWQRTQFEQTGKLWD